GRLDLRLGRVGARVGDVLRDARREEQGLLQDDRELAAQVGQAQVAQVDAVELDAPGGGVVEAHEQADERRLAGAGRAGDRDVRAGRGLEGDVLQRGAPRHVGERDAAEGD